jgi:hypothetical protein
MALLRKPDGLAAFLAESYPLIGRCPSDGLAAAIITNLRDRVQEARLNGGLGEVAGLQTSLRAASAKLVTLDRMRDRPPAGAVNLGMPIITTD